MSEPDSPEENHASHEWLRQLKDGQITREEARAHLEMMRARLDFLVNLKARIPAEFANEARSVEDDVKQQKAEIAVVQQFLDEC